MSFIHPTALVADDVCMEPFCYIGPDCVVESGCHLFSGVKLMGNVWIGENTKI